MNDQAARLEVFPIAIGHYHDPRHRSLDGPDGVQAQVDAIEDMFADYGGILTGWDSPMPDRGADAVNARITTWATSGQDLTVLYWVGHGTPTALAHARSPNPIGTQGTSPEQLAEAIARRYPAHTGGWAVVIIDTCHSARFVQRLSTAVDERSPVKPTLLIGTSGDGSTNLGRFTGTLRRILRRTFGGDQRITLWDLTRELRRELTGQHEVVPKRIEHAALHRIRPALTGSAVDIIDEVTAVLADLPEDELRHFIPKSQGAELGELTWYFEGRQAESAAIAAWLREHRHGMLVVTGPPGSGKSALLGHMLVHSRPALRDTLVRHGLITPAPPRQQPPDNAFDVVAHLAGLTPIDVIERFSANARLAPPRRTDPLSAQLDWLAERMAERGPVTILVDALDEAINPIATAGTILRRLATLPSVRLLVGTRRSTLDGPDRPDPADSDLLDALGAVPEHIITVTHDGTALARYVGNRLNTAITRGQLHADPHAIITVSTRIGTSNQHFLFGRLAVHEILTNPQLLTPAGTDQLLRLDHRQLFARAVGRLAQAEPAYHPLLRALAYGRGRGLPIRDGIWATIATALAGDTPVTDTDADRLLTAGASYIAVDREHGQTVYRLAHRTFAEHFTQDFAPTSAAHHDIAHQLLSAAADQHPGQPLNPYLTHHLCAHTAIAGQQAWRDLARHPDILDRLDPQAVAADAMCNAFGYFPLPPPIAGVIGARHLLATAALSDRRGLRQLAMTRHTAIHRPANYEPDRTGHWSVRWAALRPTPTHLTLTGHTGWVEGVAAVPLPDGRTLLATGSRDGTVRLWDPTTGHPNITPLTAHNSGVRAVAAVPLPDGRTLLATGDDGGTVRLWDPATGRSIGEPRIAHNSGVRAMAAVPLPDGRTLLATGDDGGTVRLWDPATGRSIGEPRIAHNSGVRAMTAVPLPDGRTLLATGDDGGTVRLWDPAINHPIGEPLTSHTEWVLSMAAVPLPDGRTLLATGGIGWRLWDPTTGRSIGEPRIAHNSGVRAMTAVPLPDGRTLLATGNDDGTVRLSDPTTDHPVVTPLTSHAAGVQAVAAVPLPDGRTLLATGSDSGKVALWDPTTYHPTAVPPISQTRGMLAVAAVPLPDGRMLLATGDDSGTVRLWDPTTDHPTGTPLTGHAGGVEAVAAVPLPDGRILLATGSRDGTVGLWDPTTGHPAAALLIGHPGCVRAVAAVPLLDGRTLLATGSADGTVRLWDPTTGSLIGTLTGHLGWVGAMAAVPLDGQTLLATGSADGTVRLWDPITGRPTGTPLTGYPGGVSAVVAVPLLDGRTLLATTDHCGTVRLWDLTTSYPISTQLTSYAGRVEAVAAVPLLDGRTLLATANFYGTMWLWDPTAGREIGAARLGISVRSLAHLSHDRLAAATDDGIVVIALGPRLTARGGERG